MDPNKERAAELRRATFLKLAAETIVAAYERADERNGGGVEMDWDDMDAVCNFARKGLGPSACAEIRREAKLANYGEEEDTKQVEEPVQRRRKAKRR